MTEYHRTPIGISTLDGPAPALKSVGYVSCAQHLAGSLGKPVAGVVINALAHRRAGFEYARFTIPLSKWAIDEWRSETLTAISNLLVSFSHTLKSGEVVPNREACVSKYGRCPYFSLCQTMPELRARTLFAPSFFVENEWDPTRKETP